MSRIDFVHEAEETNDDLEWVEEHEQPPVSKDEFEIICLGYISSDLQSNGKSMVFR